VADEGGASDEAVASDEVSRMRIQLARAKIRVSVQSKLLGAFGLVVLLMLGIGLIAVTRLGSENKHSAFSPRR
jgi:hypothetical protein